MEMRLGPNGEIDRIFSYIGIGAAGGVLMPTYIYGDYLTTNGFWLISYAEWMKIIGSIYICCLLSQMGFNTAQNLIKKVFKRNKRNEKDPAGTGKSD